MQPGDEWVYRLRDSAPSERVRIVETTKNRHNVRATVEYLDGEDAGRTENVPGSRLRVPWSEAAEFDERMANWDRLDQEQITEHESYAAEHVLQLLVPSDVAVQDWKPVSGALAVEDADALSRLLKSPIEAIQENVKWFQHDDVMMLSPEGTVQVAATLCRSHPETVLKSVLEEEERIRIECATGYTGKIRKGKPVYTEPDSSWESYLEIYRPIHELLREWCGHRAVTSHERLAAAEAEAHRLDKLLGKALLELEKGGLRDAAEELRAEHIEERIAPSDVRPLVERRHEPEVIYETKRRGRWWS